MPHSVFNATQCIILYKVCKLRNMCDYAHLSVTQKCVVHTMSISFAPIQRYAAFIISVKFYTLFLLLGPINLDLRYFVAKSGLVIYAFFGVNFIL